MKLLTMFFIMTSILATREALANSSLAFNLSTAGITTLNADCSKSHGTYTQCGPATFIIDDDTIMAPNGDSPVILLDAGKPACIVAVYTQKTCAHGGCGYQVYVDGVTSQQGYTCIGDQYSHAVFLQKSMN
jgi:hypothetical protein